MDDNPFVGVAVLHPRRGDLIEIDRVAFSHWAVYVGNGHVVHFKANEIRPCCVVGGNGCPGTVRKEQLRDVVGTSGCRVNNYMDTTKAEDGYYVPMNEDDIVEWALSTVGFTYAYHLGRRNCEHFATWCRYKIARSLQIKRSIRPVLTILGILGTGTLGFLIAGPAGAVIGGVSGGAVAWYPGASVTQIHHRMCQGPWDN